MIIPMYEMYNFNVPEERYVPSLETFAIFRHRQ